MKAMVRFAMCALFPAAHGLPGLAELDVDAQVRGLFADLNFLPRLGLVVGALVFVLTPVLTVGVPLPAFLLSAAQLDRHALGATQSKIYLLRSAVLLVKMFGGMCWGQHPRVREKLGMHAFPADPRQWRTS